MREKGQALVCAGCSNLDTSTCNFIGWGINTRTSSRLTVASKTVCSIQLSTIKIHPIPYPLDKWEYLYLNKLDTLNLKVISAAPVTFQSAQQLHMASGHTILDGADYRTFPSPQKVLLDSRNPERNWQGRGIQKGSTEGSTPSSAYSLCPNLWLTSQICVYAADYKAATNTKESSFWLTEIRMLLF